MGLSSQCHGEGDKVQPDVRAHLCCVLGIDFDIIVAEITAPGDPISTSISNNNHLQRPKLPCKASFNDARGTKNKAPVSALP